jgi:hypothetical protein
LRRKKGGVDVLKKMWSEAEHFYLLELAALTNKLNFQ